jgi:hypothetical protein
MHFRRGKKTFVQRFDNDETRTSSAADENPVCEGMDATNYRSSPVRIEDVTADSKILIALRSKEENAWQSSQRIALTPKRIPAGIPVAFI